MRAASPCHVLPCLSGSSTHRPRSGLCTEFRMLLYPTYTPPPTTSPNTTREAGRVVSSLDPQELTVDPHHADDPCQRHRFRGVESERSRWLEIIPKIETTTSTILRHQQCGSQAWVQYSPSRTTRRIISNTCKLRVCPACRRAIQQSLADRLWWAIGEPKKNEWKFVTLTLKHSSAPLDHQLAFLKKSFRKLRQRKLWRTHVQHGWALLELARNEETNTWHPHLHCIVRCNYIPQASLSKAWESITHGSKIVDIRIVKNSKQAAKYVAKYVGKPPDESVLTNLELASEYYHAIKGSRLLIGFGRARPDLPDKVEDGHPDDWIYESTLASLLASYEQGDPEAERRLATINAEPPYPYYDPLPPNPT